MIFSTDDYSDLDEIERSAPTFSPTMFSTKKEENCISILFSEKPRVAFSIDYVDRIYEQLRSCELKYVPKKDFLESQVEIKSSMRFILIDWLIDVSKVFRATPPTMYLAANILDRYLSVVQVPKKQFQLVGIASFFIAFKYEEKTVQPVDMFAHLCAGAVSASDILSTELKIHFTLGFCYTIVTPDLFIPIFLESAINNRFFTNDEKKREDVKKIVNLISNNTILFDRMSVYSPSLVAASCIYLACELVIVDGRCHNKNIEVKKKKHKNFSWDEFCEEITGVSLGQIKKCVRTLKSSLEEHLFSRKKKNVLKALYLSPCDSKFCVTVTDLLKNTEFL